MQKSKLFTCVADILFEDLLALDIVAQVPLHTCTCFEYFDVLYLRKVNRIKGRQFSSGFGLALKLLTVLFLEIDALSLCFSLSAQFRPFLYSAHLPLRIIPTFI